MKPRASLLQEIEPLAAELGIEPRRTGDVAAGFCKAGDKSLLDRVIDAADDDRNNGRGLLRRAHEPRELSWSR